MWKNVINESKKEAKCTSLKNKSGKIIKISKIQLDLHRDNYQLKIASLWHSKNLNACEGTELAMINKKNTRST